jgi:hypothetical protein
MHNRELGEIVDRYVLPDQRYMKFLHGGFMAMGYPGPPDFGTALATDARQVSDDELTRLFDDDWRAQITAAWLAGLDRRTQFRDRIGELLLAGSLVYAGQGFCFALARFGTHEDARLLADYLDRYLSAGPRYDQAWALGALLHIDATLTTHEADRFLGAWADQASSEERDPEFIRTRTDNLCSFADDCMR